MIVTAVVCPPAPLLVPGLADRLAARAADFCAACETAVAALAGAERVVIVAAGPGGAVAGPGDVVTAGLARSDRPVLAPARLPGGAGPAAASPPGTPRPVVAGTAVGLRLVLRAGIAVPTSALQVASGDGVHLAAAGRTGLLVMADGAACHGEHAPGAPDPRSEGFDADLVTALRSGDPATLAATCRSLGPTSGPLRAESLPALAAMAALTADNGPARAELLHYSAPFGVGYPVAVWQWG